MCTSPFVISLGSDALCFWVVSLSVHAYSHTLMLVHVLGCRHSLTGLP